MTNSVSDPNPTAGSAATRAIPRTDSQPLFVRYFFFGMAVLFIVVTLLGFIPDYQMMHATKFYGHWLPHVHGAIMAAWLLVFCAQTFLAARGHLSFHRQLGLVSVGLGALVWISMVVSLARGLIMREVEPSILATALPIIPLFGLLFTWGILARKKIATHKRLLFFATLILLQAAVDRIHWLPGIWATEYTRYLYLDSLMLPLFVFDFVTLRSVHRITAIGAACLVGTQLMVSPPAWTQFWYERLDRFVERPPKAQLSNAQIGALLGSYGGKDIKMVVSRESDRLYMQMPNQAKWELWPVSETELIVKNITWRLVFEKDAAGRVTKLTNLQPGVTWSVPRMDGP